MGSGKRPNKNGKHNTAEGRSVKDLTNTAEGDRVLRAVQELGHRTLSGIGTSGDIGQPRLGAEHEPAPQGSESLLPANQHVASSPEK